MPDGLVTGRGVGEDDVLHLGVTLKHADSAFEEGLAEGGEDNVRRVVAQHLDHVLVHDLVVHLLEAKEVFLRELGAVAVVEGPNDLGERDFLFGRVRFLPRPAARKSADAIGTEGYYGYVGGDHDEVNGG